jgi:hypothetical protein
MSLGPISYTKGMDMSITFLYLMSLLYCSVHGQLLRIAYGNTNLTFDGSFTNDVHITFDLQDVEVTIFFKKKFKIFF